MRSVIAACAVFAGILAAQTSAPMRIESWVTTPDRSSLFQKQTNRIEFHDGNRAGGRAIVIDETAQMQSMDGFGFALTGANAEHLIKMSKQARALCKASSELQR
jgi:glucosylceramidase